MSESPSLTLSCEPNHHLSKEASVTMLSLWAVVTVTHYTENSGLKSCENLSFKAALIYNYELQLSYHGVQSFA